MLQAVSAASGTVELWFLPYVGPQEPTYTEHDPLLPGTSSKTVLWVDCEGDTELKARQGAKDLCFFAQLAVTEEQTWPVSALAAAFIPWVQRSDVFKGTLLGSIPRFICVLEIISPVVFFSSAGESSPCQRWHIPVASKHALEERIFCLWIMPDGIKWLVALI